MEKIEEVVYYVLENMMLSMHGSDESLDGDMPLYTNAYNMYAYYFGCLDFHKDNNRIQQKQRMNEQHARQGERRDRRTEDDEAVHVRPRTSTVCTEHVRAFIVRNLSPPPQPPRRALPLRTTSCTSARKRVVLDHLSPPRRADTTADMHIVGRRALEAQIRMRVCARGSTCDLDPVNPACLKVRS